MPRPILFYKKLKGPAESAGPFPFLYVSDDIFRLLLPVSGIIISVPGVWRSLVARSAGGREVAGSNPVTPIFCFKKDFWKLIPEVLFCYLPSTFLPSGIFSSAGGLSS